MSGMQGRTVLVTGAGGHVGGALARRLVAGGAKVFAIDLDEGRLNALKAERPEAIEFAAIDLNDEAAVEQAVAQAESRCGPLWGAALVAGGWQGGQPVEQTPTAQFDAMLSMNLRSAFLASAAVVRRLVANGGGRLVLVGSLTAATQQGMAGAAAYNVAKSGVIALARAISEESRSKGVFACAVAPGTIDTPANRNAMPSADPSRWAPIDHVVEAILAGLSPRSGLSGAVLTVPGLG